MSAYAFKALDEHGRLLDGVVESPDLRAAADLLVSRGLFPTEVAAAGEAAPIGVKRGRSRRLRRADVTLLTGQIASLLQAGFPVTRALDALAVSAENPETASLLEDLKRQLEEGGSFAEAVASHPAQFGQLYVAMVRAGEASGKLGNALARLAAMREREEELSSRAATAMVYPAVVAAVLAGAVAVLIIFVIPSLAEMFKGMEAALPAPTRALMALADLAAGWWHVSLLAVLLAAFALRRWLTTEAGRRRWDGLQLALPGLGEVRRKLAVAQLAKTLSTLLSNGVPLLEALAISKDVAGNVVLSDSIAEVACVVEKGERIAPQLERSGLFPPLAIQMIALGEESGQLESMLANVAERYDRETRASLDAAMALVEPVMTAVMGLVVGGVVLAMILPIFQLGAMGQ